MKLTEQNLTDIEKFIAELDETVGIGDEAMQDISIATSRYRIALSIGGIVGISALSDEEMREPIENALYATNRFTTTQATDLSDGILEYIKDAGYMIVRNQC